MYPPDPAPLGAVGVGSKATGPTRPSPSSDPLLDAIGNTPLLPLSRLVDSVGGGFELRAKAEFLNPTGSVKDRAAWGIVSEALRRGDLADGRVLLDASSGNTAVSYAMLGARLHFPVEIVLPANAHPTRVASVRRFGARVIFTEAGDGTDGAQREARRRATESSGRYFYPDQYNNPANPLAHYRSTGPEIWAQSEGRITHFVAGVGTGGTVSGAGRFLKEANPHLVVVGVEPPGPLHGIEGLKHLPSALRPSTYDATVLDDTVRVETEDALQMQSRLAREEGLRVGASAGAAVWAALSVGQRTRGSVVVTVLPDAGHDVSAEAPP